MTKKLYRSKKNRIITGLLGGLGEYFTIDTTLLRVGFIFLVVVTGIFPFVIGYILAAIVVPEDPERKESLNKGKKNA